MQFSMALAVFTLILIPVFLALLWRSKEGPRSMGEDLGIGRSRLTKRGFDTSRALAPVLLMLSILSVPLLSAPLLRGTVYFYVLSLSIVALIFVGVLTFPDERKYRVVSLASAVMLNFGFFKRLPLFSSGGISIGERSAAFAKLVSEGSWNTDWSFLNSYYNPFPMDLGLRAIVSQVATTYPIGVMFSLVFILVVYLLGREITEDWRIGVLSVVVLTFTPPLNFNPQPMWISFLLALITFLAVFKLFKGETKRSYVVVVNLCFAAAIFTHAVAGLILFLILVLMFLSRYNSSINIRERIYELRRHILVSVITALVVIMAAKWIYTAGALNSVLAPIEAFWAELFEPGSSSQAFAEYVPLYDRYAPSWVAYSWSLPVAMGSAVVLYGMLERGASVAKEKMHYLALFLIGGLFLSVGLAEVIIAPSLNLNRYVSYPGFVFFLPLASIALYKISRSSKVLGVFVLALLLIQPVAAIHDPGVSPGLYPEMHSVGLAGESDYATAQTIARTMPSGSPVVASYEILVSFEHINSVGKSEVSKYGSSLKIHRHMMSKVLEDENVNEDVTYIWSSGIRENLPTELVYIPYDSGRHIVFRGS